tara:strand:+ start:1004 stop:1432 length:429 start_codon:yes stop_codon:yes gene_type:complete
MDSRDTKDYYAQKQERKNERLTRKQLQSEDNKNIIVTGIALAVTFCMVTVMITQLATANTNSFAQYPKSFIPFWSKAKRGYETTLLNTNQIVRIEPIFDPSADNPNHKDIVYLKVYLTDGTSITVEEDFEDFYSRVRVSQSK